MNEAGYPSTIVLPITTKLADTDTPLRLRLSACTAGLDRDSDVLVAQVIALANESFRKQLGALPGDVAELLDRSTACRPVTLTWLPGHAPDIPPHCQMARREFPWPRAPAG